MRQIEVTPRLASAYVAAWEAHADELERFCGRYDIGYVRADAERPVRRNHPQGVPAGTFPRMTFGAMPAWQAWLLLGGAGALAAWLFLRKLRPPRMLVASLLALAPRARRTARAHAVGTHPARGLARAHGRHRACARAGRRPAHRDDPRRRPPSRGRVLIVVDSSWSMLAGTRSDESRWDRARGRRPDGLPPRNPATATALATTADGLVEGPDDGPGSDRFGAGPHCSRRRRRHGAGRSWPGADTVHFITDGATARPFRRALSSTPSSSRRRMSR